MSEHPQMREREKDEDEAKRKNVKASESLIYAKWNLLTNHWNKQKMKDPT